MVRVDVVAHKRHGVVRLVLDVGEDEDAGFCRGGKTQGGGAEKSGAEYEEEGAEFHAG
jgi:hypothetical protein